MSKPRLSLIPWPGLVEASRALEYGNAKHGDGIREERPSDDVDAALRHIFAHVNGELLDDESLAMHLGHAIARLCIACKIEHDRIDRENALGGEPEFGKCATPAPRVPPGTVPAKPAERHGISLKPRLELRGGTKNDETWMVAEPSMSDDFGCTFVKTDPNIHLSARQCRELAAHLTAWAQQWEDRNK